MTNLTLNRELQNMAERLAENSHDMWAKKMKEESEAMGGGIHPQMVLNLKYFLKQFDKIFLQIELFINKYYFCTLLDCTLDSKLFF